MESAYDLYMKDKLKKMGILNEQKEDENVILGISKDSQNNAPYSHSPFATAPQKPSAPNIDLGSVFKSAMGYASGVGSLMTGIGSIYDAHNRKKYQDKIFNLEKERVERAKNRESSADKVLQNVWGK